MSLSKKNLLNECFKLKNRSNRNIYKFFVLLIFKLKKIETEYFVVIILFKIKLNLIIFFLIFINYCFILKNNFSFKLPQKIKRLKTQVLGRNRWTTLCHSFSLSQYLTVCRVSLWKSNSRPKDLGNEHREYVALVWYGESWK